MQTKERSKNILAIDYGERYIGLAVESVAGALPLESIDVKKVDWQSEITKIAENYNVGGVIVGISEGNQQQAMKTEEFCDILRQITGNDVELVDESMTSKIAEERMRAFQVKTKAIKRKSHSLCAYIMLKAYLENLNNRN